MAYNKEVTLIKNSWSKKTEDFQVVKFNDIFNKIKEGSDGLDELTNKAHTLKEKAAQSEEYTKIYRDWKASALPAIIPAGVWDKLIENEDGEIVPTHGYGGWSGVHTGFITLDFDNIENVQELTQKLKQLPYVFFMFISPSGKGIKVFICVDPLPKDDKEHKKAWEDLQKSVEADIQVKVAVDKQCKNINRLCYLAHDPEPYANPNASMFQWEKPKAQKSYAHITDVKHAEEILEYISADDREDWINVGIAMKREGLPFHIWDAWSRKSNNFNPDEDMQKRWDGFNPDGRITWGSIIHMAKEKGYTNGYSNGHSTKSTYQNGEKDPNSELINLSPLEPEENILPKFPESESIFTEAFEALYEAYAKTHVWSPEMLMAMGIGAISFVGRNSYVRTHEKGKAFPLSSYILAVGESDLTAKSEAITEVKKWLAQVEDKFQPLSNIQSMEGVLKALQLSLDDKEYGEATRYCLFDEGSIVFENTRRSGTKNLLAGLNELWLCPASYATGRAADVEGIEGPYLCCWGNIPTKLIASVFRMDDMIGGSLNRWMPFFIQPKRETMRYPHAGTEMYDTWIKILKAVTSHPRVFTFTEEADDARFNWFQGLREKAIDENKQTGETRYHTQAVRIAGIFALSGNDTNDDKVHTHHWEKALEIVRYLHNCGEYLYRNIGATRLGEMENEIIDVLNENGNDMTLSDLTLKTRRFDADERNRILDILEKDARILRHKIKSEKGRPIVMIRRIN